ncbi:MAG: hypothetical protein A3I20_02140 [Candidatus Portnoybacteria bacterium RIFCSPLOWO2_02_FULL_40_15]|uniref:Radical SAM core domain-containing protein n=2 Tax=Candidatus Portnoyibacteriota TaxID=1817913 RepID=A0A1G2FPJ3_9BACT|nr:MAG: hypothetical protein A3I20_02140 [Candidatus Portnoybacteria bacterium RIFCSPLOWO2_02_FULL_40_15]
MMNNEYYRLSRWCKCFKKSNTIAFLHSLSLALVFVDKSVGQKIIQRADRKSTFKDIDEQIIEELKKEKLLVGIEYDEMKDLVEIREKLQKDRPLEIMYLLLTDYCNLKCKYCFEEVPPVSSQIPSANIMDIETAKRAIEVFAELTMKYGRKGTKRVIHFYGGEPLLNQKAVRYCIENLDELKKFGIMPEECEVAIVTNGVLLDEKIIKFFSQHNVSVGVSFDGPAYINNIYRKPKERINIFPVIRQNYELLRKYKVKTGISATLTPEVVQNFDEVLNFFINDIGIQDGISFNILHYNPAVPTNNQYFKSAAQCIIKAFEKFRKLGIYEERMMRKVTAFIDRETMFSDCGAMGNQIVVAPDGLVGMCQDFVKPRTYFTSSVYDSNFGPKNSDLFKRWIYRSPLFMEQCFDCEALGICGGGCPASVELKTGSIWNIDERICPHSKQTIEWLIWDTYSKLTDS